MAAYSKLKGCHYDNCPLCNVSTDIDNVLAAEKDRGDSLLKTLSERNEMIDERNKTITMLRSTLTEVLSELEDAYKALADAGKIPHGLNWKTREKWDAIAKGRHVG